MRGLPEELSRDKAHPLILVEPAEVVVRQVTLEVDVEVFEDLFDLLDAELDPQVVEVLLELRELDRVVKVGVEVKERVAD